MSSIEGLWVKNFGPLRNIALGTSHLQTLVVEDEESKASDYRLGPVTLIVGKSDVGKSSLMDIFHFLSDALLIGLEDACFKRGGYDAIHTQGNEEPISIGINFRVAGENIPLTYAINFSKTKNSTPKIDTEALIYRSSDPRVQSVPLMLLQNHPKTVKHVITREPINALEISMVKQTDNKHLGLALLGSFSEAYPDAASLKRHLEGWYLSCYTPHDALGLSPVVPQKHFHRRGDSLVNAVREMEQKYHDGFSTLLAQVAKRMPKIENITYEKTESGRLLLFFQVQGCSTPLSAQRMSDGMLRLFSHLLLLLDDLLPPLVGMEEPENGMDRYLLDLYVESLIKQVVERGKTQFFITTHSPELIDRVRPESVWLFEKMEGETRVRRASDDPMIRSVFEQNQPLPDNWFSTGDFLTM